MFTQSINYNQQINSLKLDASLGVSKQNGAAPRLDAQFNLSFKKKTETTPQRQQNQSHLNNTPSTFQTQSQDMHQSNVDNKSVNISHQKNTPSTFLTLSPQTKDMQQSHADNRTIPSFATPSTLELKQSYVTPDRRAPPTLPQSGTYGIGQYNYINKRKSSLTPPITPPKSQGIGLIMQSGHQYQELGKKLQNENRLLESRLRKLQQQVEDEKDIKKKHIRISQLKETFIQMIDEYETQLRLNQNLNEQVGELEKNLQLSKEQQSDRFLLELNGQQKKDQQSDRLRIELKLGSTKQQE